MVKDNLFVIDENKYGSEYQKHLFEQYKIYIDSIEKISDRRQHANNYFITINTALISLIGLFCQLKITENICLIKSLIAIVGVVICAIFWCLIRSYKQLNTAKFKVLHEIENKLPLALYQYEWVILGEGKNKNIYYPFSHIELFIPWVFGILYVVIGIFIS
jgi:hypothetical protein